VDVHRGERIIAFCHYTETVEALRRRLASRAGVATLTAHGARVASGRVSRQTVLSQFVPPSSPRVVDPAQRIDLLIATDVLSEGLNLQEASVIVHLDLPWNPARLDQRVGRARRLGSRHSVVTVYSLTPPTSAERLLRIHERLREKLQAAQRAVGVAGRILPAAFATHESRVPARSLAEQSSVIDRALREWVTAPAPTTQSRPAIAAIAADVNGFITACRDDGVPRLLVELGDGISDDATSVVRALSLAAGPEMRCDAPLISRTLDGIDAHLRRLHATTSIDFVAAATAHARRATLARVAKALARTPRHKRAVIAPLADAARAVATTTLGEGAERVLATLVNSELPDEAWLRSIATFGEMNARPHRAPATSTSEVVGVIILVRRS